MKNGLNKMSKIALGTVQFGVDYGVNTDNGKVPYNEVIKILNIARSNNIKLLDTAPSYGFSEEVLGKVGIQDFEVVTKTRSFNKNIISSEEIQFLNNDFNQSLKLLSKKSIYGILIHNPSDLLKPGSEKIFEYLQELKKQGLISKIGVSVYTYEQFQKVNEYFDVDLIQLPLSILDRRLVHSGVLNKIYKKGIEIHARSIFLQGLLLMSQKTRPKKFDQWRVLWSIWDEWLNDNHLSPLEASIRYAISLPQISKVLVGVDSSEQLRNIISVSDGVLPEIPRDFFTDDINLLNPSNWNNL